MTTWIEKTTSSIKEIVVDFRRGHTDVVGVDEVESEQPKIPSSGHQ